MLRGVGYGVMREGLEEGGVGGGGRSSWVVSYLRRREFYRNSRSIMFYLSLLKVFSKISVTRRSKCSLLASCFRMLMDSSPNTFFSIR